MSLREQKLQRKKEDIIRSAATILQEKGLHGTTMEEIAAQLLMTKGSLYHYFKNKEDLLFQCHKIILDTSNQKITEILESNQSSIHKIESVIRSHIHLSTEENVIFSLIDKPESTFSGQNLEKVVSQRSYYANCIDKILEEGVNNGDFKNINIKLSRLMILGSLNWIQQWYQPDSANTPEDISDYFVEKLVQTLIA
ncbi:TetR/AcrR family transcriptional regulator [Alteribacillus bidgolensis]|uniref:Transcriptional regulator, TetR family n=1 Tax=Alteribacillus bidgolensis TaxID=930129 RepID=A0A1G8KXS1_9BACI|nr:TetR/AcrR family transcriptional regulator [Alteribacillus bidgolensis]SDI48192.1 transcriptional regulator, TetR family [Alteribacillus bidgolensis]